MRNAIHLLCATIVAFLVLAPVPLAKAQVGRSRQIGSPTRDSGLGQSGANNSSNRRMNSGTTQQRMGSSASGGSNSGARRSLFGNSGSAAGNQRPRNTTLNPAAKDPIIRNPALLDPVTGVQETGPLQRSGVFDSTGRSFVDPTHVNDAAFANEINPEGAPLEEDVLGIENSIVNPATANANQGNDLNEFWETPTDESGINDSGMNDGGMNDGALNDSGLQDGGVYGSGIDGAAEPTGNVNTNAPPHYTFPGVDSGTSGSSAGRKNRTTVRSGGSIVILPRPGSSPLVSRQVFAERLGFGFDRGGQNLALASVTAGSWAERLGFRPGDRLVGIGGRTIKSYADLATFLRSNPTGSTTIDYARAGQIEQLSLNLGSLTRRLQASTAKVSDPNPAAGADVTASGRRIAGTAAEAVRAARLKAEQQQLRNSTE